MSNGSRVETPPSECKETSVTSKELSEAELSTVAGGKPASGGASTTKPAPKDYLVVTMHDAFIT
jgi:hypothetical protein